MLKIININHNDQKTLCQKFFTFLATAHRGATNTVKTGIRKSGFVAYEFLGFACRTRLTFEREK